MEDEKLVTVNLKMPSDMRDRFKKAAKKNNLSMQAVMFFQAREYIDSADDTTIKIVRSKNGRN